MTHVDLEDVLDMIQWAQTDEQKAEARRVAEEYLAEYPGAPYIDTALKRMDEGGQA